MPSRDTVNFAMGFMKSRIQEHQKSASSTAHPEQRTAHAVSAMLLQDFVHLVGAIDAEDLRRTPSESAKQPATPETQKAGASENASVAAAIAKAVGTADLPAAVKVVQAMAEGHPPDAAAIAKVTGIALELTERVLPKVVELGGHLGGSALKGVALGLLP